MRSAALHFTLGYTPVALRAAKTKLNQPLLARKGVGYAPGVKRFAQPLARSVKRHTKMDVGLIDGLPIVSIRAA